MQASQIIPAVFRAGRIGGGFIACWLATTILSAATPAVIERADAAPMPAPLGAAPVAVLVAAGEDYPSAARAASGRAGDLVFRGSGDSMTPIYRNGTSVVVTPVRYGQLRKGMAVVYVNRRGQYVAHLLVARKAGGWVAVGAANSSADGELVTPDNLIGVVTQAFTAAEGSERMALQEAAVGMQVAALR